MTHPIVAAIAFEIRHGISKSRVRRLLKEGRELFLDLGAGDKRGAGGWITIDVKANCDLYWDLRRGIPFPDESVKRIYSSHFFEHLTYAQAQVFLDECKRVLAPGGTFSICVPNARIYIEAYAQGDSLNEKLFFDHAPAYNRTTRIDYINYIAYMGGEHQYMFDEDNLLFILGSKGFKNPRLRKFDPGIDMLERDFESIYAEAEKA